MPNETPSPRCHICGSRNELYTAVWPPQFDGAHVCGFCDRNYCGGASEKAASEAKQVATRAAVLP